MSLESGDRGADVRRSPREDVTIARRIPGTTEYSARSHRPRRCCGIVPRFTTTHRLHEETFMRRLTPFAILAALSLGACASDDPEPTAPPTTAPPSATAAVTASASANTFAPSTVTIARGGTVTWTFGARPHNVTFGSTAGAPASVPTTTNAAVARQFP